MHLFKCSGNRVRYTCAVIGFLAVLLVLDHLLRGSGVTSAGYCSRAFIAVAAALITGTLCTIAYARWASQRLAVLVDKFNRVSAGDYASRVEIKGTDEFTELSRAFNSMVESLSNTRNQLVEKANTDVLTGLNNHRHFQEQLTTEFSRAVRYGVELSLLMIDIDHFKVFNDMNGHPAGDSALREIGLIIAHQIRDVDFAARYGGEEFAIILPDTTADQARVVAERIRKAVDNAVFENSTPQSSKLTLSIGIAEMPAHCSDKAGLLRAADGALYQAKTMGRNIVVSFDGESGCDPKPDPHKLYVLLHATDVNTVEALASAIDAKHAYPTGHSVAVARLASEIGNKLGLPEDERTSLYAAALLRDIGQIAIPDAVIEKSDTLSKEEMELVEKHPVLGYAIVQKSPYMAAMLPAILHHHERFDGAGYPEHLAGPDIPLSARIIAVADAYQSMMVTRPYRDRLTAQAAKCEMERLAGSQFDPMVVEALSDVIRNRMQEAA